MNREDDTVRFCPWSWDSDAPSVRDIQEGKYMLGLLGHVVLCSRWL